MSILVAKQGFRRIGSASVQPPAVKKRPRGTIFKTIRRGENIEKKGGGEVS